VSCFSSRASTRQRPYLPVSHLKNAGTPISNGLSIVRVRPPSSARRTFHSHARARAPLPGQSLPLITQITCRFTL
jgi:hypothetical protein